MWGQQERGRAPWVRALVLLRLVAEQVACSPRPQLCHRAGKRIFGTAPWWKMFNLLWTGGRYQHGAKGLEGVLKDAFDKDPNT